MVDGAGGGPVDTFEGVVITGCCDGCGCRDAACGSFDDSIRI